MIAPMALLAAVTVAAPLLPGRLLALQAPAVEALAGPTIAAQVGEAGAAGATLRPLVQWNAILWITLAALAIVLRLLVGKRAPADETWGCGYAAPTARMQYTAFSFSQLLTERLVPRSLRARTRVKPPRTPFPEPAEFASDAEDPLTRAVYEPAFSRSADRFAGLRWLQQGLLHLYIFYILVAVLVALAWSALHDWMSA
jgi:hypothetical protein